MNINFNEAKLSYKLKPKHKKKIIHASRIAFWFILGAFLSLFFTTSFGFFAYQKLYEEKVYSGIYVNNVDFGGKTKKDVENYFRYKNSLIGNADFLLTSDYGSA